MRVPLRLSIPVALVSTAMLSPGTAHAFSFYQFQSPSGNVFCGVGTLDNGNAFAQCEIVDRSWSPPPRPTACEGEWGDRIGLNQGRPATFECHGDTLRGDGLPTLDYGRSYFEGPVTCSSEESGVTCSDISTGHYFTISRESYGLG